MVLGPPSHFPRRVVVRLRRENRLRDPATKLTHGTLYESYADRYCYFESVVLLRRGVAICASLAVTAPARHQTKYHIGRIFGARNFVHF